MLSAIETRPTLTPGAAGRRTALAAALCFLGLILVLLTWPQARYLSTRVAAHSDPYFGTWRIAWIAHALGDPHRSRLFDTNIFYPELRTLAYSDATLLEGIVGAPFIWFGARPLVVYNCLLLFGMFASAAAMLGLCLRLTGSVSASLVPAIVFGFAPYHFEHFMHLELQWTMFIPLSLLFLHETFERRSFRSAVATGVCVGLQFLSCVYYGVFLLLFAGLMTVLEAASRLAQWRRLWTPLTVAAVTAAVIVIPYVEPYRQNARSLNNRDVTEVREYSASLSSYLASTPENWLYGWTAERFGSNEARLFPGSAGIALAIFAWFSRHRRYVWLYVICAFVSIELSLGLNGPAYTFLYDHLAPVRGLRAPARFGIFTLCAVSVLAGFGADALRGRLAGTTRKHLALAAIVCVAILECVSVPVRLMEVAPAVPPVYQFLRTLEPGALMELPVPTPDRLPGYDPQYVYWSTTHWRPLINGYSGYYPRRYLDTLAWMTRFPEEEAILELKRRRVRYLLLHRGLYSDAETYDTSIRTLLGRHDILPLGTFRDWISDSTLLELR